MCTSTRFPEAISLRNIKAKTFVIALIEFFTLVGLPKSIQSDQCSNLMSGVFQQVIYELGKHQFKSSAYHPEIQGAIEWFHQTLKNMFKIYCHQTGKDWDEGVYLIYYLNSLSYVSNFRHKLSEACELAQNNLRSVQSKMKERYDRYTQSRYFNQEIRF